MSLGQDVLTRLPRALACEWMIANGIGGSASGTAAGAITRHTHAALAAHVHGRPWATLLRIDERVLTDEGPFELACVVQPNGTARPAGHRLLESFTVDPWPAWRYRVGLSLIEKTLMLVWGHDAVIVSYRLIDGPALRMTASPVLVSRPLVPQPDAVEVPAQARRTDRARPAASKRAGAGGAHTEVAADPDTPTVQGIPGRITIQFTPEGVPLTLWHNGAFLPGRAWTSLRIPPDDPATEPAYLPGYVEGQLAHGASVHVVASTERELFRRLAAEGRLGSVPPRTLAECVAALEIDERERQDSWLRAAGAGALDTAREAAGARKADGLPDALEPGAWTRMLASAVGKGFVRHGSRLTIASALPLVEENTSAALRSVLALLAVRGFGTAREILRGCLEFLNEGRVPERYEIDGTPVYGDPEPALWLVIAGERYVRRSEDLEFGRDLLYPALEELMRYCRSGAPGGLRIDSDGLLMTIQPPDAEELAAHAAELARAAAAALKPRARSRPAPEPPRSRTIKRSDLNALWYHAYVAMAQLARGVGRRENAAFYVAWAHEHQTRFNDRFWDPARHCLYTMLRDEEPVPGLMPSQLWAASFTPALLPRERAMALVETIDRELVTPFGLRLAPRSEVARVEWLPLFLAAHLRANGRSPAALDRARERVAALCAWMAEDGLGTLPETWGVSETQMPPPGERGSASPPAAAALLRLWVEDLDHVGEEAVTSHLRDSA